MAALTSDLTDSVHASLSVQRDLLERTSTAERVAAAVRNTIVDGTFPPGARLSEPEICKALGVSRNTVREAFRVLAKDRLVDHKLNRGVFVRMPTLADIAELYQCRRVVECAAIRTLHTRKQDVSPIVDALQSAVALREAGDWTGVGTADIHFHRAITALTSSRRLTELMEGTWAELRLVFLAMGDPQRFHRPYLERNRQIVEALLAHDVDFAERLLLSYLDDAEREISAAYERATASS
ncbi:GntR family transcriptional regulator [Rhodococcoides fascians]|uniref:GntR family transcriptional regulator n=1 Tax=Rhodococcoides fascians TaxID=1828 RepID=UPI000B9A4642|nr:GntR family transcriptional regulator [Rhodococcus fascians]OZE92414.1 GntR family transcriptional regulator [Rhodococcus fascians]OZF23047.1 GntR family transcriptional regulator [Rhodococcus fascians]OZF24761.1 GntR family transcriptional regulator [Rhodococcus fascians]OZF73010.1 GntR family transcriptional regulator [Rhodococcus fascians]OZF74175.1 GntR family transcriptional regulator [Rhodococcus fascians]